MVDITPDDHLSERDWSQLGVILSRDAWKSLDVEDIVAGVAAEGASRTDALRRLARRLAVKGEGGVSPGRLVLAALIKDVQRHLIDLYCAEEYPDVLRRGLTWVADHLGERFVADTVVAFTTLYPPPPVRAGVDRPTQHLDRSEGGRANRDRAIRELAVLYLATANRAMRPFMPLFDDAALRAEAHYTDVLRAIEAYFERQPLLRGLGTLFQLLRAPIEASPDDLEGQLRYILDHFADLLPEHLRIRLLRGRDILAEETTMRGPGPGPIELPVYSDHEYEAFTPDRDWMSNVVLIAKQTHVWLDQLSRQYDRTIRRLDQIPDETLDQLARWGFTGLWLIGVWERSPASREIKRRMGNPEAMASAYSLYDYVVSEELGGQASYEDLAWRAGQRGIRLAADMVPNHVGIYSKWVIEHPDWFIQLPHPPFPGYRFSGADLSWHPDVEVRIEDGYWNHTDAAVVFQRRDSRTGELRYIYHGNDGTQMPWNDTAQLDYLNPEVREAVIQTILQVARRFPIIRFDAAMTLAKRHYRRLWYPAPGEGGAIPSRAQYGISHQQFEEAMPKEFWREVVDRVGEELPDTLLMAEAFWLMEGFFVRTLGMHRVYNSAFMNMLKMEDNARYRQTLKDVLGFTPEVLKRFVNFMNNPDERTALEQFGKGDKYFGICTLLVTLPGLPMFGHGQIEGFAEKYGMEYPRAYWDESADLDLVSRHEREIFPLMRRRQLFSQADHFVLYDFFTGEGGVDENVFAYSNRGGGERALVVYNNAYQSSAGWVRTSTAKNVGRGGDGRLVQPTLSEALDLEPDPGVLYAFRDHNAELTFLRSGKQLADGLFVELGGYQCHVFLDWREIAEVDATWWQLHGELSGRGVPDLDEARLALLLRPVHQAFTALIAPSRCDALLGLPPATAEAPSDAAETDAQPAPSGTAADVADWLTAVSHFLEQAGAHDPGLDDAGAVLDRLRPRLDRLRDRHRHAEVVGRSERELARFGLVWALLASLGERRRQACQRLVEWRLSSVLPRAWDDRDDPIAGVLGRLAAILLDASTRPLERRFFEREDIRDHLLVHRHGGITWFHRERMDLLLDAIELSVEVECPAPGDVTGEPLTALRQSYARSAFQYDKLLEGIDERVFAWLPPEPDGEESEEAQPEPDLAAEPEDES